MYSVGEEEGMVTVCAAIVSGELRRDATVALSTQDGTASGRTHIHTVAWQVNCTHTYQYMADMYEKRLGNIFREL